MGKQRNTSVSENLHRRRQNIFGRQSKVKIMINCFSTCAEALYLVLSPVVRFLEFTVVTAAHMVVSETQQLLSVTGGADERALLNCELGDGIRKFLV